MDAFFTDDRLVVFHIKHMRRRHDRWKIHGFYSLVHPARSLRTNMAESKTELENPNSCKIAGAMTRASDHNCDHCVLVKS